MIYNDSNNEYISCYIFFLLFIRYRWFQLLNYYLLTSFSFSFSLCLTCDSNAHIPKLIHSICSTSHILDTHRLVSRNTWDFKVIAQEGAARRLCNRYYHHKFIVVVVIMYDLFLRLLSYLHTNSFRSIQELFFMNRTFFSSLFFHLFLFPFFSSFSVPFELRYNFYEVFRPFTILFFFSLFFFFSPISTVLSHSHSPIRFSSFNQKNTIYLEWHRSIVFLENRNVRD